MFSLARPLPSSRSLAFALFALSRVLLAGPTSLRRACSDCDCRLSAPVCMVSHQAPQRSPGSRSESFPACVGSLTTPVRNRTRDFRPVSCCLPHVCTESASGRFVFAARYPSLLVPLSTLRLASRDAPRKTRGQRWFATPFFVGLFHPRLSAGLPALTNLE